MNSKHWDSWGFVVIRNKQTIPLTLENDNIIFNAG